MVSRPDGFVVLLPVKSPGTGKSRLATLSVEERGRLAAAFARDALSACLATDGVLAVLAVSDDPHFAGELAAMGAATCADPGGGLNHALRHAAAVSRERWPEAQPVALCADLPALRPEELATALELAASYAGPCYVRDADGTGTTLYIAAYDAFDPRFGAGSAAAHEAAGSISLPGELRGLRRDVDDAASLAEAVALGVGESTRAALPEEDGPIG